MKAIYHTPSIWTIEGFLSASACEALIASSEEKGYEEAAVSLPGGAQMIKGIRNNYRLLYLNEDLAKQYWLRLKPFCPKTIEDTQAVGLHEQFRFYKYEQEQRFKKHIDGRLKRNEQEESRITFMIYLNDDFDGGETAFEQTVIVPKKGDALCFIHEQKHEGCPLKRGTKYVLRSDVMYRKVV